MLIVGHSKKWYIVGIIEKYKNNLLQRKYPQLANIYIYI